MHEKNKKEKRFWEATEAGMQQPRRCDEHGPSKANTELKQTGRGPNTATYSVKNYWVRGFRCPAKRIMRRTWATLGRAGLGGGESGRPTLKDIARAADFVFCHEQIPPEPRFVLDLVSFYAWPNLFVDDVWKNVIAMSFLSKL